KAECPAEAGHSLIHIVNDGSRPRWEASLGLLGDRNDDAATDRVAALTDGEALLLLHRDRRDQLDVHGGIVARHDHLGARRQRALAGHVGGPEGELRTGVVEERSVTDRLLAL